MQEMTIDQLAPIIPPDTVSFWPPQPGWFVLLGLLLIVLCFVLYKVILLRRKNRYRSIALQEVQNLTIQNPDISRLILLNKILKATALQGFPRTEVASLYGEDWLNFLDSTVSDTKFRKTGEILAKSTYYKADSLKINAEQWANILEMSKFWIKKHKVTSKHYG